MLKVKQGPLFGITLSKWGSVTPLACRRVLRAGRLTFLTLNVYRVSSP